MEWKDAEWWLRLINKMLNKIWSKNVGLDESAAHGKDASSCLVGTAPTPAAVHKGGFILCFLSSFLLLKYSTSIQLSMTFLSSWQLVCKCVIGSHTYPSFVTLQKSNETIPKSIWHIYFVHMSYEWIHPWQSELWWAWACWATTTTKSGECENLLPLMPRTHNSWQTK